LRQQALGFQGQMLVPQVVVRHHRIARVLFHAEYWHGFPLLSVSGHEKSGVPIVLKRNSERRSCADVEFLVHIMLVRCSKTLIFQCFQKLRYLTSAFNRPRFREMIADIEAGIVKRVIIKDMSRFGRDYLQVGMYTEIMFPEHDVHFIAVNDGVDSTQGDNEFTPFRNIINENCP